MSETRISKSLFKAKVLEFLRQVETTGEPLIVTDNGQPTVEIRRFRADKRSPVSRLQGSVIRYTALLEPVAEGDWEMLR